MTNKGMKLASKTEQKDSGDARRDEEGWEEVSKVLKETAVLIRSPFVWRVGVGTREGVLL